MEENKNEMEEKQELNTEDIAPEEVETTEETPTEEASVKSENSEVEELKNKLEEEEERYKRLFAEFENFKKRTKKDRENIYGMVTGDVVSRILPIMDNLEKAAEVDTPDKNYKEGINLVVRQFSESLKDLGLEEIETIGQTFDPEFHEAISSVQDPSKGEKEIVQEYRKGYKIGNKVIRHSMVIVAN